MNAELSLAGIPRALPQYDVVIVHYKNEKVYALLRELADDEGPRPAQIVIADNSGDFDQQRVGEDFPLNTKIIQLDNPGYGAAVNTAAASITRSSPFLLVLTHEVKVFPGAIRLLLEHAVRSKSAGIVGPVLVDNATGTTVYSAGGSYLRGGRPKHLTALEVKSGAQPEYVDGAVMLIRRDVFDMVRGFDERFFLYYEDNDLCQRIKATGHAISVATSSRFGQQPGNFTTYYQMRNQIIFSRQYSDFPGTILAALLKAAGAVRASLRSASADPIVGAVRGAWDGVNGKTGPDTSVRGVGGDR